MKYYSNYSSEEAYQNGKRDYGSGHRNYDYEEYSDRERDRAYFDGQRDAEKERRDRERREKKMKFVLLEGIKEHNRFFSTYTEGEDASKLEDGTIAYIVLGYADSMEEAQIKLFGHKF